MRTVNCNPISSQITKPYVIPILRELFADTSIIIWEYYDTINNNILYIDSKHKTKTFNDHNTKWTTSWMNPLKNILFDVNDCYTYFPAGGYLSELVLQPVGAHISILQDIDVFLVCTNNNAPCDVKQRAREHAVNYFIQYLYKNTPMPANIDPSSKKLKVIIQQHVLTFYNPCIRPIQLIITEYKSFDEIFKYFDNTGSQVGYYNGKFIISTNALYDLQCIPPQMTILRKSPSMSHRILKYMSRGFALNIGERTLTNCSSEYLDILGIKKYISDISNNINKTTFYCKISSNIENVLEDESIYNHIKYQYDVLATNIHWFIRGIPTKYIESIDIYDPTINNYQLLFHKNLPELKYQITGDGTLNPIINEYNKKFKQMYLKCNLHNMHNVFPENMRVKYINHLLKNTPKYIIDADMYSSFTHFISIQLTDLQYIPPTFDQPQRVDNIFYEQI